MRALPSVTIGLVTACNQETQPGDTTGEQRAARWEWHGRIVTQTDSSLTLTRIHVDSGLPERHDVLLVRYDFDPALSGAGDEYSLILGLDLGSARDLPMGEPLSLGEPPARIPAVGTVTCLCRPLRPDSVRGTFTIYRRGVRQITARIDATLHFTAWHDTSVHAAYRLRQRLYGVN